MHELPFSLAALPAPTRIFGLPMRPYSLGHELHLIREQNPILSGDRANVLRQDLAQAVFICSHSFEECRRISFSWTIGLKLKAWQWRMRKVDYKPHLEAFYEYRQDGCRFFPEGRRTVGESSGKVAGAPFLLRLYQFLTIEMREPNAWDYPLGLAQMQFAAYWEDRGGYQIYSELDRIQNEALAALDAEEAAARKEAERCRA